MRNTGSDLDGIARLSRFMLPGREARLREVLDRRTRWMTVCMENTFHPQNASAIIRHCDAFGVQDIHTVETLCRWRPNTDIVRGTDKWLTFRRHDDTAAALADLRRRGYRIVATSPHAAGSVTPDGFDVGGGPFALVFGTEHEGISPAVEAGADELLRIPMCGFVESLNLSASAAILIQALSSRLRASPAPWGLTEEEKAEILFEWMKRSVRDAERILARSDK